MKKVLVIGDAHTSPGMESLSIQAISNLGNILVEEQPEIIVIIGDWFEFGSLSHFDKPGSKEKENKRLKLEVIVGLSCFDTLMSATDDYNESQRSQKKKQYKPEIYFIRGNHEERLERLFENYPQIDNVINLDNELRTRGINAVIRYGKTLIIDGVGFTHVPFKSGRPIASVVNTCGAALDTTNISLVFGHTHRLEYKEKKRTGSSDNIQCLNVGCFFTGLPSWIEKDDPNWWRGVVLLDLYGEGKFDYRTISIDTILGEF